MDTTIIALDEELFEMANLEPDKAGVVSSLRQADTDRHAPQVIEFVRANREHLLDFWNNGTDWPSDEVHTFLNSFTRIG